MIPPILGITPFVGIGPQALAGLAAVYFIAFFVKGIFGYGAISALVVGASFLVPPHQAVLLAAVSGAATQVQLFSGGWRDGDRAIAGQLAIWAVPAIGMGVWLFASADETGLGLMIGLTILALVLLEASGLIVRLEPVIARNARVLGPVASVVSGLVAGLVGAGGVILLSIYIKLFCPEKRRFRGTVLLVATVFVLWRVLLLVAMGLIGWQLLLEALILAPAAWLGGRIGSRAMTGVSDPVFFRAYQGLLILASVLMIWQTLGR